MNLTRKALTKTGTAMLILMFCLVTLAKFTTMDKILQVENETAMHSGTQALIALNRDIDELAMITEDWGQWDDSYEFVGNLNPSYIDSNMVDSTFTNNHLNFIIFMDKTGTAVYERGFSWRERKGAKVPTAVCSYFSSLIQSQGLKEVSGIIDIDDVPHMVSAKYITSSDGQAEPIGLLIMGRNLDKDEVQLLSEKTNLKISLQTYTASGKPFALENGAAVAAVAIDDLTIRAYAPLKTLDNKDEFYLQVDIVRSIYQQGMNSVVIFIAGLIVLGLIFCFMLVTLIRRDILRPLSLLAERVGVIGRIKDSSARIDFEGTGEMASLAKDINSMLDRLEEISASRQKGNRILVEKDNQLRFILANMNQGFLAFGEELKIYPESSAACLKLTGKEAGGADALKFLFEDQAALLDSYRENLLKALQTQNSDKAAHYFSALPADISLNDRKLELLYRLASDFKTDDGFSVAVFINDNTERFYLNKQLEQEQGKIDMLYRVLDDSRGFAELADHYIYFYTKEMPAWYEESSDAEATARQLVQRLNSFASKFCEYRLMNTSRGLDATVSQIIALLDKGPVSPADLNMLVNPHSLESLFQTDLIVIEYYLGDDLLHA